MKRTSRDALRRWLDDLAERYTLVAPHNVEEELLFRPVTSSDDIVFDFERTALSPKGFLLPDTDVLLEVESRGDQVELREPAEPERQVIFGVRPCDARGLRAMDALLLGRAPADAAYGARREATTLVGLACPQLWDECFCTSLGGAPDEASDVDVMVYAGGSGAEAGSSYWVEVVTEKGAALLEGLEAEDADGAPLAPDRSGETVPVLPPEAWGALFEELYWRRLADRCLSCHACTYVCPTCRCFDVRDATRAAGPDYAYVQRLRAWDSCLAAAYRRIAGGHNPRPTKAQRLRNRYYCKFCYSPTDFGAVACTGCGRCIAVCPVGIDIAEMLADVAELAEGRPDDA